MGGPHVFHPDEGPSVELRISEVAFNPDCGGGSDVLLSPNTMASTAHGDPCTEGRREILIVTFDDVPA